MEEEILNKAEIKIIYLVKNEAEKLFNSISEADNICFDPHKTRVFF